MTNFSLSDLLHVLCWILLGAFISYCYFKIQQLKMVTARLRDEQIASRTITRFHAHKAGKVSDKWSSYLTYYDALFAPLKDEALKLFEIGIQNGGSLEVWSTYFRNAQKFIGCDINPVCAQLRYDDPRISVLVGDANSAEIVAKVHPQGPFDIIIDDGSHQSNDIRNSFLLYFSALKPGGIYVIEDTHCLYFTPGLSMDDTNNVLALFKELSNTVNHEFWQDKGSPGERIAPLLNGAPVPAFILDGWVDSVEFRNSIITIRKSLTPSFSKLGTRNVCGEESIVVPATRLING